MRHWGETYDIRPVAQADGDMGVDAPSTTPIGVEEEREMASYKTAFGSFLKTEDLSGRAVPVTIESVGMEDIKSDHGTDRKLVAHFVGKDKGLVLNMTNCQMIEQITGTDDVDQWPGATIVLYPTTTQFGGKTVPCLRIKQQGNGQPVAPPPAPEPEPLTDDDIPF